MLSSPAGADCAIAMLLVVHIEIASNNHAAFITLSLVMSSPAR
jgi:hypothetical protein